MQRFLDKVGLERVWERIKLYFQLGHGLARHGNAISVKMYSEADNDKTLPVSMEMMESIVGDIEDILKKI